MTIPETFIGYIYSDIKGVTALDEVKAMTAIQLCH